MHETVAVKFVVMDSIGIVLLAGPKKDNQLAVKPVENEAEIVIGAASGGIIGWVPSPFREICTRQRFLQLLRP